MFLFLALRIVVPGAATTQPVLSFFGFLRPMFSLSKRGDGGGALS